MKHRLNRKIVAVWLIAFTWLFLATLVPQESFGSATMDDQVLRQVLEDIGNKYDVHISYEVQAVDSIVVDFEFNEAEDAQGALERLLENTNFGFEVYDANFFVVYEKSRRGLKDLRKIKRYMRKIESIEKKGKLSVQYNQAENGQETPTWLVDYINRTSTAQDTITVTGIVTDVNGVPLIGTNILIKGTSIGTTSLVDGSFSISCEASNTLIFSYTGFKRQEIPVDGRSVINVTLEDGIQLDEVTVVGSRGRPRTLLETAVPIDVISADVINNSPQTELAQVLQYSAPSFHSTKQNIGHGSDHIDPMSLRGLGADQTLVLINGKRRNTTSLMNVNGTVARGQVGTDLNSIPMAAVERIEVLRDGAAAQYGSDAIAGVINVVLKENVNKGEITVKTGFLAAPPEAPDFLSSFNPYSDVAGLSSIQGEGGGETFHLSANYGIGLGNRGGFLNMTLNYLTKNPFNRMDDYIIELFSDERRGDAVAEFAAFNQGDPDAIAAYNARWGEQFGFAIVNSLNDHTGRRVANMGGSGTTNAGLMFNSKVPLSDNGEFYAFGGYNYRLGSATGFIRRPNQSGRQSGLWPLGFSPHLDSDIQDLSISAGFRSVFQGWNVDLSNTYGSNSFDWTIFNTNNASLGLTSPTTFYAGGLKYAQDVINLDVNRTHDVGFPLTTSFGGEFRLENFQQIAGQEESWQNYDGGIKEAGSQVFPGYQPGNETDKYRFNSGMYADLEAEFTDAFLVSLAGRYEEYSDFGDNFSWKLASRYRVTDNVTLRGAYSTGFRAPSMPQKFFSSFTLQFITLPNGEIDGVNIAHLNDDSFVTRQFGIPNLRPETSTNLSLGLTARLFTYLSLTADVYRIDIEDRIGITGRFSGGQDDRFARILDASGLSQVQFMTNAVDTETTGIDLVLNYVIPLGDNSLTLTAASNFTQTEIPRDAAGNPIIKTGDFLQGFETVLFNREEVSRIEVAQPRDKVILGAKLEMDRLTASINATRFGEVEYVNPSATPRANAWNNNVEETLDQTFSPKVLVDLDVSYEVVPNVKLTVGGSNIFNVYPDRHSHSANYGGGMFPYSRRVSQFGLSGAMFYSRLNFLF